MNNSIHADHVLRELALAVARNQVGAMRPIDEVLASEHISRAEYDAMSTNPTFVRYVDGYTKDLKENGFSFAAKSRLLAEDLLPTAYHMAKDPDVPAAVRAKILENFVEWADLKPKQNQQVAVGSGFSITINLPAAAPPTNSSLVLEANGDEKAEITEVSEKVAISRPKIAFSESEDYEYAGDDVF